MTSTLPPLGPLPAPRSLDLDTMQVAFVDQQPAASGPPIVLLHGGALDHRMWAAQLGALPGRRVLAPDARGHGWSRSPDTSYRLCDDVVALLDALGIGAAVLVGLSMGGGTAVDVALEYPDRVSGIVVSGTGTSEPEFRDPWVLDLLATWQRTQEAGDAEGWIEAFMAFVPGPHRALTDVDPEVTRQVEQMVRDTLANHLVLDEAGMPVPPARPTPVAGTWARLSDIGVPVLAVVGGIDGDDHLRMARTLADSVPHGRLVVVDDTAHYPNMERPEAFNAAVGEHLATWRL
ncbi:MAG: alpha/beta fold hydrolase [Nocardioidaceae bacterium]